MHNEKNELSLHQLPRNLISLITSPLDDKSLLNFRLVSKTWEQISRYFFIKLSNDRMASDKLSCGPCTTFLARRNGELWGWGNNSFNQLALDNFSPSPNGVAYYKPQQSSIKNVVKITMGVDFSLVMTKDGEVYSLGSNHFGERGISDKEEHHHPRLIPDFKATQIVAGNASALAIGEDGKLYSWGRNDFGQLGFGDKKHRFTPQVISSITGVVNIALGDTFSVAQTKNETLYMWGSFDRKIDEYFFTPQAVTTAKDIVSIYAGRNFIVALNKAGKVLMWGGESLKQLKCIEVPDIENIVKISVTSSLFHGDDCLALSKDGSVYSWRVWDVWSKGLKPQKVMGLEKIVEIGQGLQFSIAIDKNGVGYSWGMNNGGKLGFDVDCWSCDSPKKFWSPEETSRKKLINSMTEKFTKERLANATLKSEQKVLLHNNLTFFRSENKNQFNSEIEELENVINDENSNLDKVADKIDSYQKLFEENPPINSFYSLLFTMKEELSAEKTRIVKETEAEIVNLMM